MAAALFVTLLKNKQGTNVSDLQFSFDGARQGELPFGDFALIAQPSAPAVQENFAQAAEAQPDNKQRRLAALQGKLEKALTASDAVMGSLVDPEYGPVGREFVDACAATGAGRLLRACVADDSYDQAKDPYAPVYSSFSFMPDAYGFRNCVEYDPRHVNCSERALLAEAHEWDHVLAMHNSAALNATPWNPETPVILSPRDFVYSQILSERSAFAHQAWISSLGARQFPGVSGHSDSTPVSVTEFRDIRRIADLTGGDLRDALAEAASRCMGKRRFIGAEDGAVQTYNEYYVDAALTSYENAIDLRRKRDPSASFLVVRMDKTDIGSHGKSYGPNPFVRDDGSLDLDSTAFPELAPQQERRIRALEDRLGIVYEARQPTLTNGLSILGITPEYYLRESLNQGLRNKPENDQSIIIIYTRTPVRSVLPIPVPAW